MIDRSKDQVRAQIANEVRRLREERLDSGYSDHLVYKRAAVRCFSMKATAYLKDLIDRVKKETFNVMQPSVKESMAIVISSSWKENVDFATLKNYVFADVFFRDLIVDKIPDFDFDYKVDLPRGEDLRPSKMSFHCSDEKYGFALESDKGRAIDFWLRENYQNLNMRDGQKWKVKSILILDNDPYSEIWVRYPKHSLQIGATLLSEEDVDQAYKILNDVPFSSDCFLSEESVQKAIEERKKYWNQECVIS
ncbi:MAG TPA: hypothetical protein DCE71_02940 [Parachlamydiales bacterium]|nr:hypothetical protein [Parachlamydiales bacterium]